MKFTRCAFTLLAVTGILFLAPAHMRAGMNQWTGNTPGGVYPYGQATAVASDPSNPYVVYGVFPPDLYRSDDGGRTWTEVGSFSWVGPILVRPTQPPTLLVGAQMPGPDFSSGVFKSVDGGLTWTKTAIPEAAEELTASPTGAVLYAAAGSGTAYRSEDGGDHWSSISRPNSKLATAIEALVIDPKNDAIVYAGGEEFDRAEYYYFNTVAPTFSKSVDGGATWTDFSAAVSANPTNVKAIAIDPENPATLYVGLAAIPGGSVLRSTDAGATWAPAVNGLPPGVNVFSLAIDPRSSKTLYAGTDRGVYRSGDGAASWSPFFQQVAGRPLALAPGAGGRFLHAATEFGVFDLEMSDGALDVASGAAGQSHVLFWDADRLSVRTLDQSGHWVSTPSIGPFPSWNATGIADGSDGLSRVLWQNGDGTVGLELVGAMGDLGAFLFAAQLRWTAIDVSVGFDGHSHLLWTSADGQMRITSVDASGATIEGPNYGPFSGWSAHAIADGPDGATWVLWQQTDGRVGISRHRVGTLEASFRWGASVGWSAEDIAVGKDGLPRLLWTNHDGRTAISTVDASGRLADRAIYTNPAQRARRIAASPDSMTRVLWTGTDGTGALWILNPDNSVESQFPTPSVWDY